jgi:ankyrin repeat protein
MTKERAMGMGFLGTSVAVSQTSVLAFDFGSVHFDEPDSAEKASAKNNSQPDEASQLRDDWFGAARYGPLETVQAMLDQHPDLLESTDGLGKTALTAAAENGMTKVVEFLLAKGANVNARDQYGETPLLRAADDDHADTAKVLIANGADVNAKDKFGETPLHFAKEHHNKVIEQILHQHGAQK